MSPQAPAVSRDYWIVETWTIQIWDDPMAFTPFQEAMQEASNVAATYPDSQSEVRWEEPDQLVIEVRYQPSD